MFPAFFERHKPRILASFVTKLASYSLAKRREGYGGIRVSRKGFRWTQRNQSDEIGLDANVHAKLDSGSSASKAQSTIKSRGSNFEHPTFLKMNDSNEDIEAWPNSREQQEAFQHSYPAAVHVPKRDAYERESVLRG